MAQPAPKAATPQIAPAPRRKCYHPACGLQIHSDSARRYPDESVGIVAPVAGIAGTSCLEERQYFPYCCKQCGASHVRNEPPTHGRYCEGIPHEGTP